MSAFNLPVELEDGFTIPPESAFQGSKVFKQGGSYCDLFRLESREAKRDERVRSSGTIIGFHFDGFEVQAEPKTAFYDWLYARSLAPHTEFLSRLDQYSGFTGIVNSIRRRP